MSVVDALDPLSSILSRQSQLLYSCLSKFSSEKDTKLKFMSSYVATIFYNNFEDLNTSLFEGIIFSIIL